VDPLVDHTLYAFSKDGDGLVAGDLDGFLFFHVFDDRALRLRAQEGRMPAEYIGQRDVFHL
jgi:hypothetical protein